MIYGQEMILKDSACYTDGIMEMPTFSEIKSRLNKLGYIKSCKLVKDQHTVNSAQLLRLPKSSFHWMDTFDVIQFNVTTLSQIDYAAQVPLPDDFQNLQLRF